VLKLNNMDVMLLGALDLASLMVNSLEGFLSFSDTLDLHVWVVFDIPNMYWMK
jgi:hypothetical protein